MPDLADTAPAAPRFSAVIAARNEGSTIASVVEGTRAVLPEGSEILVVDDGSSDGTAEAARAAGASVLRRAPPHGKGRALRDGIERARGEVLLFLDADGQDPPEDLAILVEALAPDVDLVNGSKFVGTCLPGAISPVNRVGNRFMSGLIQLLYGGRVTDSQSGFRAVRRAALDDMRLAATEYEIETEMLTRGLLAGWTIREVAVTRDRRAAGRTGFRRVRNGLRILATIVAIRLRLW